MADDKGADTGADDTIAADKGADTGAERAPEPFSTLPTRAATTRAPIKADKGADKGAEPDWRARWPATTRRLPKRLARFPGPADLSKSFRSLEQKLSSGEFKKPLAENATPEEKATWRKENGLPEKAEEYVAKLALPNGW
jgi:hypothetical protein